MWHSRVRGGGNEPLENCWRIARRPIPSAVLPQARFCPSGTLIQNPLQRPAPSARHSRQLPASSAFEKQNQSGFRKPYGTETRRQGSTSSWRSNISAMPPPITQAAIKLATFWALIPPPRPDRGQRSKVEWRSVRSGHKTPFIHHL
jgi:hypothetical protein